MTGKSMISEEDFLFAQDMIKKLRQYFEARVVGQKELEMSLITAIIADGHILLESVPGLAKTTAARTISDAVNGKFSRIQCTPDLLPSDIIGTQIYHQETGKFETIFGPVFANFVLLDEVNRSSAKTQSAMLEAMQEKQVTIGGITYRMPQDVFIVIATQNPIEQEGTYPLSEAQTDRFMIKDKIGYPSAGEELEILRRIEEGVFSGGKSPVLSIAELDRVQDIAEKVYVDLSIREYITRIVSATRTVRQAAGSDYAKYVRFGASPRATISFLRAAKAAGVKTLAISSSEYKSHGGVLLGEADIAIDCKVPYGDAVIDVGEMKMGGLSTYASLFILNSILIDGAKKALEKGAVPPIYTSGNVEGGAAKNIALEERYFGRIKRL